MLEWFQRRKFLVVYQMVASEGSWFGDIEVEIRGYLGYYTIDKIRKHILEKNGDNGETVIILNIIPLD